MIACTVSALFKIMSWTLGYRISERNGTFGHPSYYRDGYGHFFDAGYSRGLRVIEIGSFFGIS